MPEKQPTLKELIQQLQELEFRERKLLQELEQVGKERVKLWVKLDMLATMENVMAEVRGKRK